MRYLIEHETQLHFASPVREHQCELRLQPRGNAHQRLLRARIDVEPEAVLHTYVDYYRNTVHHFGVVAPHTQLTTRLVAEVETLLDNPFAYTAVPMQREREWVADALRRRPQLWDFVLHSSMATPALSSILPADLAAPTYDTSGPLLESVVAARDWIGSTLTYRSGVTPVHAPLQEVLAARAGVCQDFAHLLIAVVRSWGFPARYVMGYQDRRDESAVDQAPHAWAEVLIPGAGWRGFDATTGLVVNDTYVAVAVGRDSLDAAPQRGSYKGSDEDSAPVVALRMMRDQQ